MRPRVEPTPSTAFHARGARGRQDSTPEGLFAAVPVEIPSIQQWEQLAEAEKSTESQHPILRNRCGK